MIFHILGKKSHVIVTEVGEICHEGKKNAMLIFFLLPEGYLLRSDPVQYNFVILFIF